VTLHVSLVLWTGLTSLAAGCDAVPLAPRDDAGALDARAITSDVGAGEDGSAGDAGIALDAPEDAGPNTCVCLRATTRLLSRVRGPTAPRTLAGERALLDASSLPWAMTCSTAATRRDGRRAARAPTAARPARAARPPRGRSRRAIVSCGSRGAARAQRDTASIWIRPAGSRSRPSATRTSWAATASAGWCSKRARWGRLATAGPPARRLTSTRSSRAW